MGKLEKLICFILYHGIKCRGTRNIRQIQPKQAKQWILNIEKIDYDDRSWMGRIYFMAPHFCPSRFSQVSPDLNFHSKRKSVQ